MPTTYTVKQGETLWGIAQKMLGSGARWKELQGYSGTPEKLPIGTVLTIPEAAPAAMEKVAEIKSQLGAEPTLATKIEPSAQLGATKSALTGATYDIGKIQTDIGLAGTSKKAAYDELMGIQSKLYESEYAKAGLADIKTKIGTLDQDLSNRKATRDKMLLDEMGKPIPQWMITGRKKLEVDAATADLNRMTDERNTMATSYNTGIDEVTKKVEYGSNDAATKYSYWEGEEGRLTNLMKTYQDMMVSELGGGISTQVVEANGRKLLVNSTTGEIIKDLGEVTVTGGEKTYGLQSIKDDEGNIAGYFNPATGETTKYEAAAPVPTENTEEEFRSKVATKIKTGESLEKMKNNPETIGVVIKPPSKKTATQIIEEEWAKANPTGWWGKFLKKLPGGY
jgi:LysM repeat protein